MEALTNLGQIDAHKMIEAQTQLEALLGFPLSTDWD